MTGAQILATGADFLKHGIRGTSPMIENIMRNSESEIHIMAYIISKHAGNFMRLLEEALERGIKITLIINKLNDQEEETQTKLAHLKNAFPYFKLVDFNRNEKTLHAKVVISDRDKAIIGSANFSWGGLSANYEIGVMIQGREAWLLANVIDKIGADQHDK